MEKVLITGARGFLGKALVSELERASSTVKTIHTFSSKQYDLRSREAITQLFHDKPCDTVIHLAASFGGLNSNLSNSGTYFYNNLIMGAELIEQARRSGVKKFIAVGTVASYPKHCQVPFREVDFWNGYPEESSAPYGLSKKMMCVQLEAYRKQYGFNGVSLILGNLYGPGDNFDVYSSHVIPAMMRKFYYSMQHGDNSVNLWGDGNSTRDFLFVDDAARAIRIAAERYDSPEIVNIGSGNEVSIADVARLIQKTSGFNGKINWDQTKPTGQSRRVLDITRAREFGFRPDMSLPMGLELAYRWFVDNIASVEMVEREVGNFCEYY